MKTQYFQHKIQQQKYPGKFWKRLHCNQNLVAMQPKPKLVSLIKTIIDTKPDTINLKLKTYQVTENAEKYDFSTKNKNFSK